MQQAWRSISAALILVTATGTATFAAPNEHASDQGKEHASDKSKGDQQQPPAHAVKSKASDQAPPAAADKNAPRNKTEGKGKAKTNDNGKGKGKGQGNDD